MDTKLTFRIFAVTALLSIATCSSESIQITPNDIEPVRDEHSKYGVTCHGPDLHDFQWRGPYGLISQDPLLRVHSQDMPMSKNQPGLLLVFESIKEEDLGSYICTAVGNDMRVQTISIKLSVTKLLEFDTPAEQTTDEYKDYFIKCKVKGNAMPTFMWSYKNQTIKDKTKSEKYSVEEGGLLVRNVTHLDAGKYTCRAFETTSKSSVSGEKEINLKVRHKPVFKTHMEGDPVEMYVFKSDSISLNCRNSAEPPANMTWSFEDASFLNPYEDYMVTFTEVKKLGLYSCTARNTLGKVTRRFRLIEGFKPKTPSGLAVGEIGENFIKLKVDAGDPADNLIGYRVEYVTKAVEPGTRKTYESFDMINFNTTTGPFALENLMPDTEYMTKILARNRAGNSNYTDTMVVRTKPLVVITGAAQPSSGGLVLHRFLLLSAAAYVVASLLGQ